MKECPQCKSCYEDILAECPIDNTELEDGVPGPTVLAGKYRVEIRLGKGGMGSVYRAMHLGLKRYIALKTLLPKHQSQADFAERFRREAEASGRIKHANVVDVMDFGFTDVGNQRVGYLVMEFLEGQTLKQFIKKQGLVSLSDTVEILSQASNGVEAAHKLGIIHRDLKPDNIWLETLPNGQFKVKVLDFGIAKFADLADLNEFDDGDERNARNSATLNSNTATGLTSTNKGGATKGMGNNQTRFAEQGTENLVEGATRDFQASLEQLTQAGAMIGTIPYMSPEQCRGKTSSAASDIYSLGIIAYEMLTGQRPFRGKGFELVTKHVNEPPTPPTQIVNTIPKSTEAAILSALAKKPEDRPQSVTAFITALGAYLVEQRRKKTNIKRMFQVGGVLFIILAISALITNSASVQGYWYQKKVDWGWEKESKGIQSYSNLSLIALATKKEQLIGEGSFKISEEATSISTRLKKAHFLTQMSPNDNFIAYSELIPKAEISIWSTLSQKKLVTIPLPELPSMPTSLQFSADSQKLLVAGPNQIYIISLTGEKPTISHTFNTYEPNDYAQFISDDTIIVASVRHPISAVGQNVRKGVNSLLTLYSLDGTVTTLVHKYGEIEALAAANNTVQGTILVQWLAANGKERNIELWRVPELNITKQWPVQGDGGLAINQDGSKFALFLENSTIQEFNGDLSLAKSSKVTTEVSQLFYDKNNSLIALTPQTIQDISNSKTLYSTTNKHFLLGLDINAENLLIETKVVQESANSSNSATEKD